MLQVNQNSGDFSEGAYNNQILTEDDDKRHDKKNKLEEFLRDSLRKISSLERNIDVIQTDINENNTKLEKIIDNLSQDSYGMKQSSELKAQLDQL